MVVRYYKAVDENGREVKKAYNKSDAMEIKEMGFTVIECISKWKGGETEFSEI